MEHTGRTFYLLGGGYKSLTIDNESLSRTSQHKTILPQNHRGGVTGNNAPYWKKVARQEIAPNSEMIDCNILESFYYLRGCKNEYPSLIPRFKSFLLDSGAFTFMQNQYKGNIDWDGYVEEYAAFINNHDIKLFFELDIDCLVGITEVERLRNKLETLTGKKSIPVWHISRGKEYFESMCRNYPYVAFGGILTDGVSKQRCEAAFPYFITTAHKYGSKIHGLGYTGLDGLRKYHFDSVDSTAWLYGNRGGYLYRFNSSKGTMDKIDAPSGHRLKSQDAAMHNFKEWIKFSKYAEKYL